MFYSKGWVEDLDKATKRHKQLTKQHDFLGSKTIKKAYFGLPSSGSLNLFFPLSTPQVSRLVKEPMPGLLQASEFIDSVVLCETDLLKYHAAEATSDLDAVCRLKRDAYVFVGGEMAFLETFPADVSPSCVFFNVPEGASLSSRRKAEEKILAKVDTNHAKIQVENTLSDDTELGLAVEIVVRSDKGNFKEPCYLAYAMWRETSN